MSHKLSKVDINLIVCSHKHTNNHNQNLNGSSINTNNDIGVSANHIVDIRYRNHWCLQSPCSNNGCETTNPQLCNSFRDPKLTTNMEATAKRLKYYHHKRQMHIEMRDDKTNLSAHRFNDTRHFYQINGTPTSQNSNSTSKKKQVSGSNKESQRVKTNSSNNPSMHNLQSNLLTLSSINHSKQQPNGNSHSHPQCNDRQPNPTPVSMSKNLKEKNSSSIININMLNPIEFIHDNQSQINAKSQSRIRARSSIQGPQPGQGNFKRKERGKDGQAGKLKNCINPYTNREYLHFLPKQKQQLKKHVQQIRKKQMQNNILKPCQINPIQLIMREHNRAQLANTTTFAHNNHNTNSFALSSRSRPLSTRTRIMKKQSSKNFTFDCTYKQWKEDDGVGIRPWDSSVWGNAEEFFS